MVFFHTKTQTELEPLQALRRSAYPHYGSLSCIGAIYPSTALLHVVPGPHRGAVHIVEPLHLLFCRGGLISYQQPVVNVDLANAFPAHAIDKLSFDVLEELLLGTAKDFSGWESCDFIAPQCRNSSAPCPIPNCPMRVAYPPCTTINAMNTTLCTTATPAIATELVMCGNLRALALPTLSDLFSVLAYVFPAAKTTVVHMPAVSAVFLRRALLAAAFFLVVRAALPAGLTAILVFVMWTPCSLHAFVLTVKTTLKSTPASVNPVVHSAPTDCTQHT